MGVALHRASAAARAAVGMSEKTFEKAGLKGPRRMKSLFEAGVAAGAGSDQMQKVGSLRPINPYNLFLGMWVAVTRRAKGYEGRLHPEEALTRELAIRFYTINNARLLLPEDRIGSLGEDKQADLVVIDRDLLT